MEGNVADDESCWFGSVQGASSPRLSPFALCLWLTRMGARNVCEELEKQLAPLSWEWELISLCQKKSSRVKQRTNKRTNDYYTLVRSPYVRIRTATLVDRIPNSSNKHVVTRETRSVPRVRSIYNYENIQRGRSSPETWVRGEGNFVIVYYCYCYLLPLSR